MPRVASIPSDGEACKLLNPCCNQHITEDLHSPPLTPDCETVERWSGTSSWVTALTVDRHEFE